jgi:iron complex outermembrane receptor protein
VQRDVKAIFTEVQVPITKELEATVAVRRDEYTGFGSTTNPKVSMRFAPAEDFMVRGSYNTGFKVPDFKQQFFGVTEAPGGSTTVDPATCPTLKVSALPGCQSIVFNTLFGGNPALQPEKSKQSTLGFVWAPTRSSNIGVDWWTINRTGTIQAAPLATLLSNYTLFPQNFNRDASGNIVQIDTRWINAGETITSGVDITANVFGKMGDARWAVNLDGSYVYEKLSRPIASAPFGANEVGLFNPSSTTTGELALRWKHALTGTYTRGPWTGSLTQLYRSGYKQNVIYASSFTPTDFVADVDSYKLYNASVTYSGIKNLDLTFGIKNLLNTDPPFAITYDTNTGAGSSWDPRVADPRGRSYTLQANYKF